MNNEDVRRILKDFLEKKIEIEQKGFLKCKFFIDELNFTIENDILILTDEDSEIYLKININQIFRIEGDKNKVSFYLDNDTLLELVSV